MCSRWMVKVVTARRMMIKRTRKGANGRYGDMWEQGGTRRGGRDEMEQENTVAEERERTGRPHGGTSEGGLLKWRWKMGGLVKVWE